MKQIKILIITFALLTVSNISLLSQFGGGDGTAASPYQISNATHLELLNDSVRNGSNWSRDKYFIVTSDITDSMRSPIGTGATSQTYNSFQGDFNGQNYTIPLAINATSNCIGLFGKTSGGSIRNVILVGYVNANNTAWYVGGIVGYIHSSAVGTRISNCVNNADIIGGVNHCGGIIGIMHDASIIENCINIGIVRSTGGLIGGIVGTRNAAGSATTITNCVNYGIIKGNYSVGGIIGGITGASSNTIISNCVNSGIVEGNSGVGCIIGSNGGGTGTTIINCHYDKQMCE